MKSAATLFSTLAHHVEEDPILLLWPEELNTRAQVVSELQTHALLCLDLDDPSWDDALAGVVLVCQETPGLLQRDFRYQRAILLARSVESLLSPHPEPSFLDRGIKFWRELQQAHQKTSPDLAARLLVDLDGEMSTVTAALQEKLRALGYTVSQDLEELAQAALRALDEGL